MELFTEIKNLFDSLPEAETINAELLKVSAFEYKDYVIKCLNKEGNLILEKVIPTPSMLEGVQGETVTIKRGDKTMTMPQGWRTFFELQEKENE